MKTKLNPQSALDSTKRTQYVDRDVLDTWPDTTGELEYFKLDKYVSAEELEEEYAKRGLLPAPYALCAADAADPGSMDEKRFVATQWKDASGKFCYLSFREWDSRRKVRCDRGDYGWGGHWFLAGVPVSGKDSAERSGLSTKRTGIDMKKEKNPNRVKAGRARWMGVSAKGRREIASKNGKKGAASFWKKYKLEKR